MVFMKNIILITGASYTGKTALAQRILEEYKYPYLSIDHLKMGLIRSGNIKLTVNDDDKLTEVLWPIVVEIIKTAIENEQNLVIEGGYIPFDYSKYFEDRYLLHIEYICIAMSDFYIDNNFYKIKKHSKCVEKRLDDTFCTPQRLKESNQFFIRKNRECVIIIDEDYEKKINQIISSLKL